MAEVRFYFRTRSGFVHIQLLGWLWLVIGSFETEHFGQKTYAKHRETKRKTLGAVLVKYGNFLEFFA